MSGLKFLTLASSSERRVGNLTSRAACCSSAETGPIIRTSEIFSFENSLKAHAVLEAVYATASGPAACEIRKPSGLRIFDASLDANEFALGGDPVEVDAAMSSGSKSRTSILTELDSRREEASTGLQGCCTCTWSPRAFQAMSTERVVRAELPRDAVTDASLRVPTSTALPAALLSAVKTGGTSRGIVTSFSARAQVRRENFLRNKIHTDSPQSSTTAPATQPAMRGTVVLVVVFWAEEAFACSVTEDSCNVGACTISASGRLALESCKLIFEIVSFDFIAATLDVSPSQSISVTTSMLSANNLRLLLRDLILTIRTLLASTSSTIAIACRKPSCLSCVNSLTVIGSPSVISRTGTVVAGIAVQSFMSVLPAIDTVPAGHKAHGASPDIALNLPASQAMQTLLFVPVCPALQTQSDSSSLPARVLLEWDGHNMHEAEPVNCLYLPTSHEIHDSPGGPV
mmetsp:Transcript_102254/g.164822  ORF Transcript_102254/g.164822 Transcript_102254/m.164822 type:complete len:458 (+) Transcript_102254:1179-2552(+)|eukprot:CAMPEP_0179436760 /NCGR_PEP_ID=MMETSP0799-20121207/20736_1 /TAXON_ID=46947 /ORGANISM="Geminigera cryophila, Strain CCMP2564" /LENGTH=457 /DNA_ID=CAMNT_0021217185 /DNA_START=1114 /DNA_END=2487 /DNA_ORIENTATION=-